VCAWFLIEEPSIDYWKRIAEARRQALEKTLIENEEVFTPKTLHLHFCIQVKMNLVSLNIL